MAPTPTLAAIVATETALQHAWARRDGATAQELRTDLARLWRTRRAELARAGRPRRFWDELPAPLRRFR
jgi:hypothetical protein